MVYEANLFSKTLNALVKNPQAGGLDIQHDCKAKKLTIQNPDQAIRDVVDRIMEKRQRHTGVDLHR